MKKILGVNELEAGMYVTRVTKAKSAAVMTSKGIIKDNRAIAHLKSLKVLEVEIDLSKSESSGDDEVSPQTTSLDIAKKDKPKHQPAPLSKELITAQYLYNKARETQRKAFSRIQSEGSFEPEEYESLASEMLDSIMRNKDALLCMTKLQDKDSYLLEHSLNVGILLAIFAKHLKMNWDISYRLMLAGLFHDMGKIKISDDILFKNGKLTKQEFEEIKKHPEYGADILATSGIDGLSVQIALQHHERLSGNGYPGGLIAHQLNQYVRMSCIVDVFDAITAERVYKPAMTAHQALKIMKENGANQYDSKLLNEFIKAIGIFSIGTVVQMESQRLGIVTQTNYEDALKPIVAIFYHTKFKRHIEVETIDLSSKRATDKIVKSVNPSDYDLDINPIIRRLILNH